MGVDGGYLLHTLNEILNDAETRKSDDIHDGGRLEVAGRPEKELNDRPQSLLPTGVLTLKTGGQQRHLVADRVEQHQTGAGSFQDAVDAVHQLLVEAVHRVGVIQSQQADQVADLFGKIHIH